MKKLLPVFCLLLVLLGGCKKKSDDTPAPVNTTSTKLLVSNVYADATFSMTVTLYHLGDRKNVEVLDDKQNLAAGTPYTFSYQPVLNDVININITSLQGTKFGFTYSYKTHGKTVAVDNSTSGTTKTFAKGVDLSIED